MKKEILRINNLNMEYSSSVRLLNISICLLAGECAGFLGLDNSGKNLLVDVISGKQALCHKGIFYNGKRCMDSDQWKKHVYTIRSSNYIIDDWNVAEYLFLVDHSSIFGFTNPKKLIIKADDLIHKFGLSIDSRKKLNKLTELEKRLVDLLKAYIKETEIMIIEDEFEGCLKQDMNQFKKVMGQVIKEKMAVVIHSHSDHVIQILSDRYIILKKGRIVKKCTRNFIKNENHLEKFLLDTSARNKKKEHLIQKSPSDAEKVQAYSIYNLTTIKGIKLNLDFYKSEIALVLALDVKEKRRIFELISGRRIDRSLSISLDKKKKEFYNIKDFVDNRVVSISDMGGKSELLLSMSVGNNLFMPSVGKITSLQHVLKEHKVVKMLENQLKAVTAKNETVKNMNVNDYSILLLERWYIYKPKVLVLFEPFVHCDIFGISLVKSYIHKFTRLGTTVIIVQSREEYVTDMVDRYINID